MKMMTMNEKLSSFSSRLVVDSTGGRDGDDCNHNDTIDHHHDDEQVVSNFVSNVDSTCDVVVEHISEGVVVRDDGWKNYPNDDYIEEVYSANPPSDRVNTMQSFSPMDTLMTHSFSRHYFSSTDTPVVMPDSISSSSSSTTDCNRGSTNTAVSVRFVDRDGVDDTTTTTTTTSTGQLNDTSGKVMQLRQPSKDEIQSILDASNVPRLSSHGKLISINEGIEEDQSSRMDTSWASGTM